MKTKRRRAVAQNASPEVDAAARAAARPLAPELFGAGVLLVATRIYASAVLPRGAEDAYITFRYAAHWAHGFGPVYNAGERVWGFSSPLWTLLLTLAAALRLGVGRILLQPAP